MKKVAGGTVINFKTSKEIYTLFGEMAQVGSREFQHFTTGSFQGFFLVAKLVNNVIVIYTTEVRLCKIEATAF